VSKNEEDVFIPVLRDDDVADFESFNVVIEKTLPVEQQTRLKALLYDFKDVFRPTLGRTHLLNHYIKLKDGSPFVRPVYRIPEALKKPLEEEINRFLEAGVLRECESNYRSPLIPIRKPCGSVRLVCDYSKLHAKTIVKFHPISSPNEVLASAAGKQWIKIDLTKTFLQVPLLEECQHSTAFQTHIVESIVGRLWPKVARTRRRTMEKLLKTLLKGTSKFCQSLIDDVIISSNSFEEHLMHLREILTRLRQANLTASISKSEFLLKSLTVLGHVLEDGKILPSEKHVNAILKLGPQKTKRGVRRLIGMVTYYKKFIPNLAQLTCCFTDLLKKGQPEKNIKWEPKHTEALQEIKRILTSKPVLVAPQYDRQFILSSDATNLTIAAILSQIDDQGCERNIAYYSRKLLPREINYSVVEKECLGVVAACTHWHTWIYGHKILVRTDHSSLRYLKTAAKHNSRLARWYILLSNYDMTWEYRKGSLHSNCDGLSRVEMND
jgi:hypothetical protein